MRRGFVRSGFVLVIACVPGVAIGQSDLPFASRVVSYDPAPGSFVDDPAFNDPQRALGMPTPGTPSQPDNTGLVTLGGFGGSITLAFESTVLDDPANPMGLDAVVFGNAFYVAGDPTRRHEEAGFIEISLDENGNGLADDAFYLIPGSALAPPLLPPFELVGEPFSGDLSVNSDPEVEDHFGYADRTPTQFPSIAASPAELIVGYTTPDDPFEVGITPGTGGGDAFDIAWAVDPATGEPAGLHGFDFIRITTGVDAASGLFGEKSTEIDAVSDVAPDPTLVCLADVNQDGHVTPTDFGAWLAAFNAGDARADQNGDGEVTPTDFGAWLANFNAGCGE